MVCEVKFGSKSCLNTVLLTWHKSWITISIGRKCKLVCNWIVHPKNSSTIVISLNYTFETITHFIQVVSKYFLKYEEHCIDDFQSIRYIWICAEKELCVPCFLANLLVFYIVDGLKGNLIICFNVLTPLCKDDVNIHAASMQYSGLIELPQLVQNHQWTTYLSLTLPLTVIK